MNTSDMGPAMGLDLAKTEGAKSVLRAVAEAATQTAQDLNKHAATIAHHNEREAVKAAAAGWAVFAKRLLDAAQ